MMIDGYLAQTVWRKPRNGVDSYGQPAFGSAVKTIGRWLEKQKQVLTAQGEQTGSEVTVLLRPDESVAVGDQLSADGTNYLDVIALSVSRGLDGESVLKRAYL